MAKKFRTKADYHAVDVYQLTPTNSEVIAIWCSGVAVTEHDALEHSITFAAVNVPTDSGMMRAQEGDYIVRFASGRFLSVKPSDFERLFEAVVDV